MICYSKIDRFERKSDFYKGNKPKEIFTDSGEYIGLTYEYRVIDGIKSLVPTGKVNRQEIISSYGDAQDINNMICKFLSGDTSVMNPNSGAYGDFTNCPTTYAELFDHVQKCKNVFDSMPVGIKEKFDNSYESFWSQFGSDKFNDIFNEFNHIEVEKTEPIVESEVKVNAE